MLGACSDPGSSADDPGTGPTTSTATDNGACTTTPTSAGLFTDPGQVLCFGTPAVLPLTTSDSSEATGRMRFAVTGIERGDDAVIDGEITEGMSEWTAQSRDLWYVRVESELLSEELPGAFEDEDPLGVLAGIRSADGEAGESYIDFDIDGTVGDCERRVFDEESTGPFTTCDWQLMMPDVEPVTGPLLGDRVA